MKKELTKKVIDFFNIEAALNVVANAPGFKFQMILALNQKVIKETLDAIREKAKNTSEFEEVMRLANEIQRKFAKKDKDGNPIIITETRDDRTIQRYDISDDDLTNFNEEFATFWTDKKNLKAKEDQDAVFKEYDEYIQNNDLTVSLNIFPESSIPNDYFDLFDHVIELRYFINTCSELFEE